MWRELLEMLVYLWCCVPPPGPRDNTVDEFWRMIWQEGVTHIVMLTNLREGGPKVSPASCYWELSKLR